MSKDKRKKRINVEKMTKEADRLDEGAEKIRKDRQRRIGRKLYKK